MLDLHHDQWLNFTHLYILGESNLKMSGHDNQARMNIPSLILVMRKVLCVSILIYFQGATLLSSSLDLFGITCIFQNILAIPSFEVSLPFSLATGEIISFFWTVWNACSIQSSAQSRLLGISSPGARHFISLANSVYGSERNPEIFFLALFSGFKN